MKKFTNGKNWVRLFTVNLPEVMENDALSYISRFVSLSDSEKRQFADQLQIMTCFPRQVLTRAGEVEQHVYFVQKGLLRKYFYRNNEEVTAQLALEGDLISANISLLAGIPSDHFIETLEPSVVAFITKSALDALYASSYNFEKMGRMILLEWMLEKERKDTSRMIESPKDRFKALLTKSPHLIHRVPQKYLASLLNIEPETFSRYKKQFQNDLNAEESL